MFKQSFSLKGAGIDFSSITSKDNSRDIFKEYNSSQTGSKFKQDKNWVEYKFKKHRLNNSLKKMNSLVSSGMIFGNKYLMTKIKIFELIK